MEVFITNLDSAMTQKQLHDQLTQVLLTHNVPVYDVRKRTDKTFAFLTIPDLTKATKFLFNVQSSAKPVLTTPSGRTAQFRRSKRVLDTKLLRVLQKEEKDSHTSKASQRIGKRHLPQRNQEEDNIGLELRTFDCGRWETIDGTKSFTSYFRWHGRANLTKSARDVVITLQTESKHELLIAVHSISSIMVASVQGETTVTITLCLSPRVYDLQNTGDASSLIEAMLGLTLNKSTTRFREPKLPDILQIVMGSCFAYRVTLSRETTSASLMQRLRSLTSHQVLVTRPSRSVGSHPMMDFQDQVNHLNNSMTAFDQFRLRFQVQALWANGLLSPREIELLTSIMHLIKQQLGDKVLLKVLQRLVNYARLSDIETGGYEEAVEIMKQQKEFLLQGPEEPAERGRFRDEVTIHRVIVTPTGVYLYGPEEIAANRVLRQYRKHQDCFIRVSFTDEAEDKIQFDRDISNERILRGRFLHILNKGLDIAGEHFDFLGFSHSSLRSQTCWFMRPFFHNESLLSAETLIKSLGDFSSIQCPAKCAARIGQAFSETTTAVQIDPSITQQLKDVRNGQYVFTDGCGTISKPVWRLLKNATSSKEQPTLYQIRYQGAKGMISLDNRLVGHQLRLRDSMVKFTGSPSHEIEICSTNARPLPLKLNRQLIKILEDLDIKPSVFEDLQMQAVEKLRESATSLTSAVDFLKKNLSNSATGMPALLKVLNDIGIDMTEDNFLRDILGALLQVQLRDLKYRSRIPVEDGLTLLGISDETGSLAEGEVFVTFASAEKKSQDHLNGRVVVTRSPALHPGDVQTAIAVTPPPDPFWDGLTNCIVFSQNGHRDLPSMLSGGDLDGDLYQVIYNAGLIPRRTESPADYSPAKPIDIGRAVTTSDMTEFFVDFMQNDQLGRIATLHQVLADGELGTRSPECLKLAALHSTAVDFSKTGLKVDVLQIPRNPEYRPDFMAPSASTKVEKGISRPQESTESPGTPQRYRYYESSRVLGRLYRAIDEDLFFEDLEDDGSSVFSHEASDNVLNEIWRFVERMMKGYAWKDYKDMAMQVRDYYESNLLDIMSQYAVARTDYLTEKEVFIGTILGRSGAGSKFQREQSDYMRNRFNRDLRDIKSWMEGQTSHDDDEFLCLATACLFVAVTYPPNVPTGKFGAQLKSFGWFAAGMCVPELVNE